MNATTPLIRFLLLAIVIGFGLWAYWGAQPPRALPLDAPAADFSGMRALEHSKKAFTRPHPAGSAELEKVRDYLVDTLKGYGLEVEVERIPVNHGNRIGMFESVMARIPGTGGAHAFAMETHYDSVPYGPGAADDGSGSVVMLEAARVLKQGAPMANDIVFVFTGDEECGGGSARHALTHPWLKDLNVLLAFEARGNHGPALMFETNTGNLPLMRELAKCDAHPQTSSIMWEVHRRTPNGTDFGGMKEAGAIGYNVAFVGGLGYYHTPNDNPDKLSPDSLQHQGAYAIALARHYGNASQKMTKGEDSVFFNTVGSHLAVYPASWSRTIAVCAVALLLLSAVYGLARRGLTVRGVLGGTLLLVGAVSLTVAISFPLLWVTYKLFYVYMTYNGAWYFLAFLSIAAAIVAAFYGAAGQRTTCENLLAGALLIWAVALVALERYLPIGSYAAAWPVVLGSLALAGGIAFRKHGYPVMAALFETIVVAPVLFLMVPALQGLYYMSPGLTIIPATALALTAAGLFAPALTALTGRNGLRMTAVLSIVAVAAMGIGWATNGFTADKPKMSSLSYALNQTTQRAIWMSSDAEPDAYTAQFFRNDAKRGSVNDILPDRNDICLRVDAPIAPLEGPRIDLLDTKTDGTRRIVILRYISPRKVNQATLKVLAPQHVYAASAQGFGDLHAGDADWSLGIQMMPRVGEVQLTLTVDADKPVRIRVEEEEHQVLDASLLGFTARPPEFIPKPNTIDWWESNRHPISSHRTWVVREFEV